MAEFSDEQLVKEYLAGDEASLEILIKRYLNQIYGFVYSYVKNEAAAEDIAQIAFIKAWKKIKKFNPEKKFKPWIFTIAKNSALDYLKKKSTVSFSAIDAVCGEGFLQNSAIDPALRPDELLELQETDNWFESAVAKLSDKYRRVVVLRQEDYSFREIAEELGEPLHTVKSRYRRALMALKNLI